MAITAQRKSDDAIARECIRRFDSIRSQRYTWESHWRDIRMLVRTNSTTDGTAAQQGMKLSENIYDGTAPWALEQLAAALNSFLSSPTERWFNIGVADQRDGLSDEALAWLEAVSDRIFREYARPEVNLNPMIHESYLDLGGFGTAVLYQDWDWEERHVFFRSFPLADCYILEGAKGRIDTVYRMTKMTKRQIMQEFSRPTDNAPGKKITDEKDENRLFSVIHCVHPRKDVVYGPGSRSKAFASCWVCVETQEMFREGGYDALPYHVARWTKLSGESYGRSPAMTCLPDIKMLNVMAKVTIKAAQKVVDPPLIVPDDGFMLPIKTSPASLIFKTAGQEDTITPLVTNARIDIGLEMMDQRRDQILKAFYVDWIIRNKKRERQTATEVMDDRNEMLRQMAPMLGRTQVELLSPMVVRTYDLLDAAGQIPLAPGSLGGRRLALYYVSPAAKAQEGSKAQNIQMLTQDLVTMAQANPEVMDAIDVDVYAQEMARFRDVTRKIIRSPDAIAQLRDARNQRQAAANMAATGRDSAAAIKDLSVAQKNGLPLQ